MASRRMRGPVLRALKVLCWPVSYQEVYMSLLSNGTDLEGKNEDDGKEEVKRKRRKHGIL